MVPSPKVRQQRRWYNLSIGENPYSRPVHMLQAMEAPKSGRRLVDKRQNSAPHFWTQIDVPDDEGIFA
jgi:hypothetical protein